jgi:arginine N-succinyltransferase
MSHPIVRTAIAEDLEALHRLALAGGTGLTNLPPDRDALRAKIETSEAALDSEAVRAGGAAILLIVELEGRAVATSCVFPRVGAEWPFYSYRLTRQAARSRAVGRSKAQTLLNLVNDFDGETEVGGLFVDPAVRGASLGVLAARARYLFIAAHRDWFGRRVIAELRGWQDQDGRSPVWEALGRHFYDMDFHEADRTGALDGNQFIADLGPRYPLYVALLPEGAREALGRPHDDGRRAYQMLLAEGFQAGDYVDIFDGGPTLVAEIDSIRSVRDSRISTFAGEGVAGEPALIAAGTGARFRMTRGTVGEDGTIDAGAARALEVAPGDVIRHVAL